jgi:IS1 family transposase
MNKLDTHSRIQILTMLCEGSSMRSISRVCSVSINTVTKLLIDAGTVCAAFHDEKVRSVPSTKVQCDEIWSFSYAKQKNVRFAKSAPESAGDVWTWTGIDADSKLIVSWHVGDRSQHTGISFMGDLKARLANRVQLTTDGHKAYLKAVSEVDFDADYAMLNKIFATDYAGAGRYSPPILSTSTRLLLSARTSPCGWRCAALPASPMRSQRSSKTTVTRWRSISSGTTGAALTRRSALPPRWLPVWWITS